jgi:hypothetical protein
MFLGLATISPILLFVLVRHPLPHKSMRRCELAMTSTLIVLSFLVGPSLAFLSPASPRLALVLAGTSASRLLSFLFVLGTTSSTMVGVVILAWSASAFVLTPSGVSIRLSVFLG